MSTDKPRSFREASVHHQTTPTAISRRNHFPAHAARASLAALSLLVAVGVAGQAAAYPRQHWNGYGGRHGNPSPQPQPPAPTPPPPVTGGGSATSWTALPLYRDPANEATTYALHNPSAAGAALIAAEGGVPVATWFGDWNANIQSDVNNYVSVAAQASSVPVLVLYDIPQRDCGSYSAGGAANVGSYLQWVQGAASGIGSRTAVVILEPDALAGLDCLSSADQQSRYTAISQAVSILKAQPHTSVYIDAGNPPWQTAGTMAARLAAANIAQADGFSLNVSNYISTATDQAYGDAISGAVGGKHYVIDTSRNGNGNPNPSLWCNVQGAALGSLPTTATGDSLNDAWLWVKLPWESDGPCNGGPAAGQVFWSYAVQLAQNAHW